MPFSLREITHLLNREEVIPQDRDHPADSFPGFFSAVLTGGGGEAFVAVSFEGADFSPAAVVAGDSFLAASLYESLR